MKKRLILNADDYGLCAEVNAAIEELIEAGRLRDVSVLANGAGWEAAARFLQQRPQVSIGAHLNAIEGEPLTPAAAVRPITDAAGKLVGLPALMRRWLLHPFAVTQAVEMEWRAQIERLRAAQLVISHLDSHQHVHAFPLAWRCAVRLAREYNIPTLRLPLECNGLRLRGAANLALNTSLGLARKLTKVKGLRHNDHFLGFKRAGAYAKAELLADLQTLPPGLTEITLHPSLKDGTPYPNLAGNRERLALLDESLPEQLKALGLELTTWKAITE